MTGFVIASVVFWVLGLLAVALVGVLAFHLIRRRSH